MPQFGTSLTDDTRVIIYDRNMFIIQATGVNIIDCYKAFSSVTFLTNRLVPKNFCQAGLIFIHTLETYIECPIPWSGSWPCLQIWLGWKSNLSYWSGSSVTRKEVFEDLYYKSFMIVIYDHNNIMIVGPVL